MKSNYKLWLCTHDGYKFFGKGPWDLLCRVEQNGSLHRSALDMNMSYSKALAIIKNAEKELGFKLLFRDIGGKNGGGSSVTPEGLELIEKYAEFSKRAGLEIERIYLEIFSEQR